MTDPVPPPIDDDLADCELVNLTARPLRLTDRAGIVRYLPRVEHNWEPRLPPRDPQRSCGDMDLEQVYADCIGFPVPQPNTAYIVPLQLAVLAAWMRRRDIVCVDPRSITSEAGAAWVDATALVRFWE